MRFAWDDEVLRCAEVLVSIFVLALILLVGGAVLTDRSQDTSPTAAQHIAVHAEVGRQEAIAVGRSVATGPR
jgi:hypothetical protein